MNCPVCSQDTFVLKTAGADRRRECTACHHRFSTVEVTKDELERLEAIAEHVRALTEKVAA